MQADLNAALKSWQSKAQPANPFAAAAHPSPFPPPKGSPAPSTASTSNPFAVALPADVKCGARCPKSDALDDVMRCLQATEQMSAATEAQVQAQQQAHANLERRLATVEREKKLLKRKLGVGNAEDTKTFLSLCGLEV